MIQKPKKFIVASFTCLILLCAVVFFGVSVVMSQRSESSISEIGAIYMGEMNKQLQQKFTAIIDLRLSQVGGIVERTDPETVEYGPQMLEELALSGSVRNFTYLAFYTEEGDCEVISGEPVEIIDQQDFLDSLVSGNSKVTSGYGADGERILFLGIDAAYPMNGGRTSTALVAGIPMSYLEKALVLE